MKKIIISALSLFLVAVFGNAQTIFDTRPGEIWGEEQTYKDASEYVEEYEMYEVTDKFIQRSTRSEDYFEEGDNCQSCGYGKLIIVTGSDGKLRLECENCHFDYTGSSLITLDSPVLISIPTLLLLAGFYLVWITLRMKKRRNTKTGQMIF